MILFKTRRKTSVMADTLYKTLSLISRSESVSSLETPPASHRAQHSAGLRAPSHTAERIMTSSGGTAESLDSKGFGTVPTCSAWVPGAVSRNLCSRSPAATAPCLSGLSRKPPKSGLFLSSTDRRTRNGISPHSGFLVLLSSWAHE